MGHGCAERGTEVSPQDHRIHITETPLGLGLLRGGPQLLSLELVPKAPNRAARDCLMPSLPKFILRVPLVLSAKKAGNSHPTSQRTSGLPMLLRTRAPTPSDCSRLSSEKVTFLDHAMPKAKKRAF